MRQHLDPGHALAAGLAAGLATHVRGWAATRGATPEAAYAAARAAQALSLAMAQGHVCLWLADLAAAVAALPPDPGVPSPPAGGEPAAVDAWRSALLASAVVGTDTAPANQPLVLDADGRLYLHHQFDLEQRLARRLLRCVAPLPANTSAHTATDVAANTAANTATDVATDEAASAAADTATAAQLAAVFGPADATTPDWQRLAAVMAQRGRLTVISGGPGTGKTSTVLQLLACLLAREPHARVVLAAPTGKAAARLADGLATRAAQLSPAQRARLPGLPTSATTVHRLLGVRPGRNGLAATGELAFLHHAGAPLALDVLVLDEASMLDLALATRLLEAVPDAARIILLGDKDQLAAVESGAVFAELSADPRLSPAAVHHLAQLSGHAASAINPPLPAEAGAPPSPLADSVVWFQRNFRFAAESGIGRLAADAVAGRASAMLATLQAAGHPTCGTAADLAWLDDTASQPAAATLDAAIAGYAGYAQACRQIASDAAAGVAPTPDAIAAASQAFGQFRVLCALRDGPRGVSGLNAQIARLLRPLLDAGAANNASPWYAGRPVMVQRNHPALKLFNGDIGLALPSPGAGLQVWFPAADGRWRAVAPERLPAHDTAWAMTVHKAQGSEFDTVLLLLPAQRSRVASRALLYTGITRARQRLLVAGGAEVLAHAVAASSQRNAGLLARLHALKPSRVA